MKRRDALAPRSSARLSSSRRSLFVGVLGLSFFFSPTTQAEGEPFALRITPENAEELQLHGPDSTAGIDDYAFGNGTLCAAVTDPAHESDLSDRGAALVDVGHCGRKDDQWSTLQPILNFSQSTVVPVTEIEAEVKDGVAQVRTRGVRDGVEIETTYSADLETPAALGVTTRITRIEEGPSFFSHGSVLLHPDVSLTPFNLVRRDPSRSRGFDHPSGDPSQITSMLQAIVPADLLVWLGNPGMGPPVAYGLELISAERKNADGSGGDAPGFAITGESYTLVGTLVRPLWFGDAFDMGLLELLQVPFMDLGMGDRLVLKRRLWVGKRADVASITDQLFGEEPVVNGQVNAAGAVIHIETADGVAVTTTASDHKGRFSAHVPPGSYQVRAVAAGGLEETLPFEHPSDAPVGLKLDLPSQVFLPSGAAMRLVFKGLGETADPIFRDDLLGLRIGGERPMGSLRSNDIALAGVDSDPKSVAVPPGRYRVFALRGPEHELRETVIEVEAASQVKLALEAPKRLFSLPGWASADLHVHTGASFDSSVPPEGQVAAFHAAAAQILVATEHDVIVDPTPSVLALGLQDQILAVTGIEVTSEFRGGKSPKTNGHANAFPVKARPRQNRGGAPSAEGVELRDVWAELRSEGSPVIQLNHPRSSLDPDDGHSYLNHLGVGSAYDPSQPLDHPDHASLVEPGAHGLRALDFDAIELMNGNNHDAYLRVRADWFSFLQQGERKTGTANSDSHSFGNPVALPRNYVRVEGVLPELGGQADPALFFEAVRNGALWGTTGPLLEVQLGETGLGGTALGTEADLRVRVRAAPWVPVEEVRVYVNGVLAETKAIDGPGELIFPLRFPGDAFVTVEVEGTPGEAYEAVAPGFRPFAYTNPIFVDADEDGEWKAPGLP